jgi:hypothetical protein
MCAGEPKERRGTPFCGGHSVGEFVGAGVRTPTQAKLGHQGREPIGKPGHRLTIIEPTPPPMVDNIYVHMVCTSIFMKAVM